MLGVAPPSHEFITCSALVFSWKSAALDLSYLNLIGVDTFVRISMKKHSFQRIHTTAWEGKKFDIKDQCLRTKEIRYHIKN